MNLRFTNLLGIILLLFFAWQNCPGQENEVRALLPKVIIIKAAGLEKGKEPEGVDAITQATSEGRNVHVVTLALQDSLTQAGIECCIIRFNELDKLETLTKDTTIKIIIFAGPAYSSQFPRQLKDVVPKLQDYILDKKILCTSLTTCRFLESGGNTIRSFNKELEDLGIRTMEGLTIHHEYEDKDWETKVADFVQRIQKAINM
jgi:flavorubredoxin